MKKIKIGVCDDNDAALHELEHLIFEICNELGIEYEIRLFIDGYELLEQISMYEIVFLDIEMPAIDGIELGKRIREINPKCKIIMATGMLERFKEAFQIRALRFVTKPFDIDEIKEAIETALSSTYVPKMIDVYCKRVKYPLIEEEIRYVKAFDGYSEIYAGNNVYRKKCSLDELETLLSDCLFVRINREILVNLRWVEHIDTGTIQIQEKEFRVSRRRKKVVEHKFIEFDLKYRKEFS